VSTDDEISHIVSRGLSVVARRIIVPRFHALFTDGKPNPEQLLRLYVETLICIGLSTRKVHAVRRVALRELSNTLIERR
jgi:3-methyladenine DNA glycosylase/8-oxoguanine DNA glycosylase